MENKKTMPCITCNHKLVCKYTEDVRQYAKRFDDDFFPPSPIQEIRLECPNYSPDVSVHQGGFLR